MACELKNNTNQHTQRKIPLAMPSLIAPVDDEYYGSGIDADANADHEHHMAVELYAEYLETHDDLLTATVHGDAPETIRELNHELDAKERNVRRCAKLLNSERKKRFDAARASAARIARSHVGCRDVYANGYTVRIINQALY